MKIEFVHDVICSFCFPMSHRMRKIDEKYPKVEISHRSFALGWEVKNFEHMFGSHEAVKPEVMGHWKQANENDDLKRFNIDGMKDQDFLFPTSKNALIAAKAAGFLDDQAAYWEVFDALQHALFVENLDISDIEVIEKVIENTTLDFTDWKKKFESKEAAEAVLNDLEFVKQNGINSVPALIIEGKYLINGAQPQSVIEKSIEEIAKKENLQLTGLQQVGTDADSCRMIDGQWVCN